MRRLMIGTLVLFAATSVHARTPKQGVIGIASWYSKQHHGNKTSSGRRFDSNELTAASPDLPFGTRVHVTFLRTGKSVDVLINDRGPFIKYRILDLSEAAADAIGLKQFGIGRVKLEVLNDVSVSDRFRDRAGRGRGVRQTRVQPDVGDAQ